MRTNIESRRPQNSKKFLECHQLFVLLTFRNTASCSLAAKSSETFHSSSLPECVSCSLLSRCADASTASEISCQTETRSQKRPKVQLKIRVLTLSAVSDRVCVCVRKWSCSEVRRSQAHTHRLHSNVGCQCNSKQSTITFCQWTQLTHKRLSGGNQSALDQWNQPLRLGATQQTFWILLWRYLRHSATYWSPSIIEEAILSDFNVVIFLVHAQGLLSCSTWRWSSFHPQ